MGITERLPRAGHSSADDGVWWTRSESTGLNQEELREGQNKNKDSRTFLIYWMKRGKEIYLSFVSTGYARGVLLEKSCCCGPPCRVFPWRLFWRKIRVTYRGWEANQCRVTATPDMKRHIWRIKQTVNKHWLDLKCFSRKKNIFSSSGWVVLTKCGFTE